MWIFGGKSESGFNSHNNAEQVTEGIDGTALTAIVTGILAPPKFTLLKDNIEQTFAVNHLGQFLLTNILLETMKRTARRSQTEGRIINVSSFMHRYGVHKEGIRFEEINDEKSYRSSGLGRSAYGLSKLCNILHTNELARRFKEEGVNITANSLHPGFITTNIFARNAGVTSWMMNTLAKYVSKDIGQGASTTCYLALNPKFKGVSGGYFVDNNKVEASKLAGDSDLAKKLWDYSLSFTEAKY